MMVGVFVDVGVTVTVGVRVKVGVVVGGGVTVGVYVGKGVKVNVTVTVGVRVKVGVTVGVTVGVFAGGLVLGLRGLGDDAVGGEQQARHAGDVDHGSGAGRSQKGVGGSQRWVFTVPGWMGLPLRLTRRRASGHRLPFCPDASPPGGGAV